MNTIETAKIKSNAAIDEAFAIQKAEFKSLLLEIKLEIERQIGGRVSSDTIGKLQSEIDSLADARLDIQL